MHAFRNRVVSDDEPAEHRHVVEQPAGLGRRRNPPKPVDDLLLAHVPTLDQRRCEGKGPSFGPGGSSLPGDGVEQAVDEAAFALVVKGVRDIDIFGDHRAERNVGAGNELIRSGAKDREHRAVEPVEGPTLREPLADQRIDLVAARAGPSDDVVEEIALGRMVLSVLDRGSEPVVVEFLQQAREGRAFHVLLVQRLDGGEASRGTRTGTGLAHAAGALAVAAAARKGRRAVATSSPASHGAKWPASGRRTMVESSTSLSSPSSWTGRRALSCMPQMTSVGTSTL